MSTTMHYYIEVSDKDGVWNLVSPSTFMGNSDLRDSMRDINTHPIPKNISPELSMLINISDNLEREYNKSLGIKDDYYLPSKRLKTVYLNELYEYVESRFAKWQKWIKETAKETMVSYAILKLNKIEKALNIEDDTLCNIEPNDYEEDFEQMINESIYGIINLYEALAVINAFAKNKINDEYISSDRIRIIYMFD